MSTPIIPAWADELRHRYLAGEASLFVVHGNVRDLHVYGNGDGDLSYVSLRGFFENFLGRTKDIVVYYNISQGFIFPDKAHERRFDSAMTARRMLDGQEALFSMPKAPGPAISLIEQLITTPTIAAGVIVDFFEMLAPAGNLSFMTTEDKSNLVSIQRWSTDPAFLSTDNLVVLVTEHLSDVSRRVISSPQLVSIHIPFPDYGQRLEFLQHQDRSDLKIEMELDRLAEVSAGLSLLQIRSLLRSARQSGQAITFRMVSGRKKTVIEQACHGLVEFVDPEHNFSHVGGLKRIKNTLLRVADAVKAGQTNRVPMGMIFVGPMGTGKTFVAEAFAAESGLTCLKFKNFRDKWVGSTESNLERVLELVEALGYVLLIIDEADRSLSGGGETDGGTTSRVIARLKEFMSDTSHRGRVVILMMTNRPDKLDTDLKRPGRFDLKIPFFFPESAEERELIFKALIRKNKLELKRGVKFAGAVKATEGYSGAELEAVLLAATNIAAEHDSDRIGQKDLDQAVIDMVPSRDTRMLQFMEMLAVFEASTRKMLPKRYQQISTDEIHAKLDQLRLQLGRRAL
jgi:ATP-dependent 26S proteasome regulatory subunit